MRAGSLRHKITFYSRADVKDAYGAMTETYTEEFSMRAETRYLKGAEIIMNSTLSNTTTIQFITRYRSTVTESMQIGYDGDRFDIRVIEVSGKKQMLKITATKILN